MELVSLFGLLATAEGFGIIAAALLFCTALLLSSFVKIATVLSIVRMGLGFDSVPAAFLVTGLSFVLTWTVMTPVVERVSQEARPVLLEQRSEVTPSQKLKLIENIESIWREFLLRNTDGEQITRFADAQRRMRERVGGAPSRSETPPEKRATGSEEGATQLDKNEPEKGELKPAPVSNNTDHRRETWSVLAPAFLVTQLKEAFTIGLRLFLPFLVVDLLVGLLVGALSLSSIKAASIAFPLKLLLFLQLDGWQLLSGNLLESFK